MECLARYAGDRARRTLACVCIGLLIVLGLSASALRAAGQTSEAPEGTKEGAGQTAGGDSGPTVDWLTPVADQELTSTILLWVTASGPDPIDHVVFTVDGLPVGTDSSAPYLVQTDTGVLAEGNHTLGATAWDIGGLSGSKSIPIVVRLCPMYPCIPIVFPVPSGISADKTAVCTSGPAEKIGDLCVTTSDCAGGDCEKARDAIPDPVRDLVKQVFIRADWEDIEGRDVLPTDPLTDYNWAPIDDRIAELHPGWNAAIAVRPGVFTPGWVMDPLPEGAGSSYTEGFLNDQDEVQAWCGGPGGTRCDCPGPGATCVDGTCAGGGSWDGWTPCSTANNCLPGVTCQGDRLPLPTDPRYLAKWEEFVKALGEKYRQHPRVASIRITGINHGGVEYGRLSLGPDEKTPHQENFYKSGSADGMQPATIQGANQKIFLSFFNAFTTKFLVLTLADPFDWVKQEVEQDLGHAWEDPWPWMKYCIKGGWGNRLIWTTLEQVRQQIGWHLIVQNNGLIGCDPCVEEGPRCDDASATACGCPHIGERWQWHETEPGQCGRERTCDGADPAQTFCKYGEMSTETKCLCPTGYFCQNEDQHYCMRDNRPEKRRIWNGMRRLHQPSVSGGDNIKTAWQMGWWATDTAERYPEPPCDLNRMGSNDSDPNLLFACQMGAQSDPTYFEIYTMDLRSAVPQTITDCNKLLFDEPPLDPTLCPGQYDGGPDCHVPLVGGCCPSNP